MPEHVEISDENVIENVDEKSGFPESEMTESMEILIEENEKTVEDQ